MYERLRNDDKASYQVLSKALKRVFTPNTAKRRRLARKQFHNRVWRSTEPLELYARDLERLFDKAFPGLDEQTRQGQLIDQFVEGLLGEISYQLELNPRETLEKTITRARGLFMLEERRKNSLGRSRTVAVVDNAVGSSWRGPSIDPPEKSRRWRTI